MLSTCGANSCREKEKRNKTFYGKQTLQSRTKQQEENVLFF